MIYMTNSDIGRKLLWIAKKGMANDWCIYFGRWANINNIETIKSNGDKVRDEKNIQKLITCSPEVLRAYRF